MRKILRVAQREYVETVKTKVFLLGTFLVPVLIVCLILIFNHLVDKGKVGPRPSRSIAVTDLSNELSEELDRVFEQYNESHRPQKIILKWHDPGSGDPEELVRRGKVDGYLVIAEDVAQGTAASHFYSKTTGMSDLEMFSTVHRLTNSAVANLRFRSHGFSPELIARLQRGVSVERVDIGSGAESDVEVVTVVMAPFAFVFMMFMGVFGANQQMLTSVIEEKDSRVMEVLLSALSPFQLMAGKILGLAAVGFTTVIVWGGAAYGAAVYHGIGHIVTTAGLGYFVTYYVLGFLLFSSLFAAIGSVCNTVKEAQALMMPVVMLLMLPLMAWFFIAQHPTGTLAIILSFIPPITPMVMILRIAAHPEIPPLQIAASIVLLAASVPLVVWVSAKIFRTGVLMYGKPPTPRELLRWVRHK